MRSAAEMSVIQLHSSWSQFCRDIFILSAGGSAYTATGIRLKNALGISSIGEVIPALLSTYKKRKREPEWSYSSDFVDAAKRLKVQNFATLSSAIGSTGSPADELRKIRNFFAHRSRESAEALRILSYHHSSVSLNVENLLARTNSSGITILEDLLVSLRRIAISAIQ